MIDIICYRKFFSKRASVIDLGVEINNEIIKRSIDLLSKYKIIYEKIYYNEIIDYDLSLSFYSEIIGNEIF